MSSKPDYVAQQTDVYFLRTQEIVRRFGDREATYAIFLRRPVISTPKLMLDFHRSHGKGATHKDRYPTQLPRR
jgi:nicotinate phosphoribosyltransferase